MDGSSEDGTVGIIQVNTVNTIQRELLRGATQSRLHHINEGPSTGSSSPIKIIQPTFYKAHTFKQIQKSTLSRGRGQDFGLQKMVSASSIDSENNKPSKSSTTLSFKGKLLMQTGKDQ